GILAAFHEANAAGGVHGRKLELISYNDDYEPEVAIAKTNKLIDEDRVFALIGEVGTPSSKAVQPITMEQGVPFIGPFTGADFLRDPSLTNVINVRASYGQETEAWIKPSKARLTAVVPRIYVPSATRPKPRFSSALFTPSR